MTLIHDQRALLYNDVHCALPEVGPFLYVTIRPWDCIGESSVRSTNVY